MKILNRLCIIAATGIMSYATPALADILIAPTRVVLEKGERTSELVFINKSQEESVFRVSIENRRMLMDGSMEAVKETKEGEKFAKDLLRYAPRRVVLEPEGQQIIRISSRLPKDIEPGEYRSHLRIMSAPTNAGKTLQTVTGEEKSDQLSIKLVAIQSVTIPVILRVGELNVEIEVDQLSINAGETDSETFLSAKLTRTGDKSTYGDIKLFVDGIKEPVYFARGIAVYVPNKEREVILPLPAEVKSKIQGKNVRLVYASSDPEDPGVMAEFSTRLP